MTHSEKLAYGALKFFSKLIARGGLRRAAFLGSAAGSLAWRLLRYRRTVATENIRVHLDVPGDRAAMIARESFRHTFRSFLDITVAGSVSLFSKDGSLACEDLDHLLGPLESGRPIVAATAHFGAWELLAGLLGETRQMGFDKPMLLIARAYPNEGVQRFIEEQRCNRGITMAANKSVVPTILRTLRAGGIAAFLVDHKPHKSDAVFLPFLKADTAVNLGPAVLAMRTNALVLPIFLAREGTRHRLIVRKALDPLDLKGGRKENIRAIAAFYTNAVEEVIREYPEQWFWMHNRWKAPV
ncbi:MAG: lysophospholipid acyltransferase family protein [Mailhella sp.]|nr:lysophospholipid acyltransferase family protein [Mailhella sp.]